MGGYLVTLSATTSEASIRCADIPKDKERPTKWEEAYQFYISKRSKYHGKNYWN